VTTDLLWRMATATERPGADRVGSIGRVRACGIHLWCPNVLGFRWHNRAFALGPACCSRPPAAHRYQRCSQGLTSGIDFVPADKDSARSLSKAECVTADGAYAAACVVGPVYSSEGLTKGGFK